MTSMTSPFTSSKPAMSLKVVSGRSLRMVPPCSLYRGLPSRTGLAVLDAAAS